MSTKPLTARTEQRVLSRLANDPHFFVEMFFGEMGYDTKAPLGEIEHDFIEHMFNGPRLRGGLSFRGFGKTTMVACGLALYRGFRDPTRQILIPSKSLVAPKETITLMRELIEHVWFLNPMSPTHKRSDSYRDAATYFDFGTAPRLSRQPSVKAIGLQGQLEGNRAHTIIPDDCETKKNTKTADARIELRRLFSEFINILYPHRPHEDGGPIDPTEIVVIGTPKHSESLYVSISNAKHEMKNAVGDATPQVFKVFSWPIAVPPPDMQVINLAPMIANKIRDGKVKPWEPTCPHRFGNEEIAIRQGEGQEEFEREQMLVANVSDEAKHPLRLKDFIVFDIDRDKAPDSIMYGQSDSNGSTRCEDIQSMGIGDDCFYYASTFDKHWSPFAGTKMRIDPAGKGADEFAYAIASHLNGRFFLKDVNGFHGGATETNLTAVVLAAKTHGVNDIIVEGNSGWGLVADLLMPIARQYFTEPGQDPQYPLGWKCGIRTVNSTGNKFERICNTLEAILMQHRVVIDRRVAADPILQWQLTRITRTAGCIEHDDRVDAVAGVIQDWNEMYMLDPSSVGKNQARERILKALREDAIELELASPDERPRGWINRDGLP